jgi:outer membrane immunogenic protein
MKRILLASVGFVALVGALGPAVAADLPRQMMTRAPAYVAPFYNWTGFYVGLNGGGGFGSSSWDGIPAGNFNVSGGMIGGTVGYNWQYGAWVFGLEGDVDWTNLKGSTNVGGFTGCGVFTCTTRNDWLATARGRVGYAFDRWLPYVTGGLAVGNIRATSPGFAGVDNTNAGWTVGAGVEFAIAGNWTAKAEYLYVDLGNTACGTACGFAPAVANTASLTANVVRGGINYRF